MKTEKIGILLSFLIILALFGGIFIGRKTVNTKTKIEYIKQEPVFGSIDDNQLVPIKVEVPTLPYLPVRIDTVYKDSIQTEIKYIVQRVDTAAIIADYILKRSYNITAFDSKELGTLKLFPTVQYNQLLGLDYEFTPVLKQMTIYKEKVWQPFLSGSYSTLNYINFGVGVFYHDLGFEYQFQKDIGYKNNGHLFGLKYKF